MNFMKIEDNISSIDRNDHVPIIFMPPETHSKLQIKQPRYAVDTTHHKIHEFQKQYSKSQSPVMKKKDSLITPFQNFEYTFYDKENNFENSQKVAKFNQDFKNNNNWLQKQFQKLTSAFIIEKLSEKVKVQKLQHVEQNKVKWSQLFLKQPNIQGLITEYFQNLERNLQIEFNKNQEQINNYLNNPVAYSKKMKQFVKTLESTSQPAMSYSEEKNQILNQKHKNLEKLRGFGQEESSEGEILEQEAVKSEQSKLSKSGIKSQKYFDQLPKVIKDKNRRMIEQLNEYTNSDPKANRTFLAIVSNTKDLFAQKLEKLQRLNDQYENIQIAKQNKVFIQNGLNEIMEKIANIESETQELEIQFSRFADTSDVKKINRMKPTQKLMSRLEKWQEQLDEQYMDSMDQEKYAQEYWQVNEEFEKQLQQEDKGWERERRYLIHMQELKIQKMKEHFQFHISSIESAMCELKISSQQKINQLLMTLNDFESQKMNTDLLGNFNDDIDAFIKLEEAYVSKLDIGNLGNFQEVLEIKNRYFNNMASMDSISSIKDVLMLDNRSSHFKTNDKITETLHYVTSGQGSQLNHRIIQYFKYMKLIRYQLHEARQEISKEKNNVLKIQEEKEQMHRKVVKYQDLVFGMVSVILELSLEYNFINTAQQERIQEKSSTENLKLSIGVSQIDELVQSLESLQLQEKLKEFRKLKTKLEKQVEAVVNKSQEIIEKPEFQKMKNEPKDKKQMEFTESIVQLQGDLAKIKTMNDKLSQTNDEPVVLLNIRSTSTFVKPGSASSIRSKSGSPERTPVNNNNNIVKMPTAPVFAKTTTVKNVVDQALIIQKALKSNNIRPRKRERITFFGDQTEIIIKSLSKKKIYYQYDQLSSQQITKSQLKKFERGLRHDPICTKLYNFEDTDDSDTSISCLNDNEEPNNFDDIIRLINNNLQIVFKQVQVKQFSNTDNVKYEELQELIKKQKILPIDCLRVDPYMPPQLNLVPLKLLLLQEQTEQAIDLIKLTLKYISNFYCFDSIKELFKDKKQFNNVNLRQNLYKDTESQTEFDDAMKRKLGFMDLKSKLNKFCEQLITENEKNKKIDKAFLGNKYDHTMLEMVKFSLIFAENEKEFLKELNFRFQEEIVNASREIREEEMQKIANLELLQRQQSSINSQNSNVNQKVETSQSQSQKQESVQEVRKKSKISTIEQVLIQEEQTPMSSQLDDDTESPIVLSDHPKSQNQNQNQNQPKMLRLLRQDELIKRSMIGMLSQKSSSYSPQKSPKKRMMLENNDIETQFSIEEPPEKEKFEKETQTKQNKAIDVQIQSTIEHHNIKKTKGCETEVSMSDINLMLQFKQRSVQKILALENQLKAVKQPKSIMKQNSSFLVLPQRPESGFQSYNRYMNKQSPSNYHAQNVEKLQNKIEDYRDSLRAVPPGFFMLAPKMIAHQGMMSQFINQRCPSLHNFGLKELSRSHKTLYSPKVQNIINSKEFISKKSRQKISEDMKQKLNKSSEDLIIYSLNTKSEPAMSTKQIPRKKAIPKKAKKATSAFSENRKKKGVQKAQIINIASQTNSEQVETQSAKVEEIINEPSENDLFQEIKSPGESSELPEKGEILDIESFKMGTRFKNIRNFKEETNDQSIQQSRFSKGNYASSNFIRPQSSEVFSTHNGARKLIEYSNIKKYEKSFQNTKSYMNTKKLNQQFYIDQSRNRPITDLIRTKQEDTSKSMEMDSAYINSDIQSRIQKLKNFKEFKNQQRYLDNRNRAATSTQQKISKEVPFLKSLEDAADEMIHSQDYASNLKISVNKKPAVLFRRTSDATRKIKEVSTLFENAKLDYQSSIPRLDKSPQKKRIHTANYKKLRN